MISFSLVVLVDLALLILGSVLWWRARGMWLRRVSLSDTAVAALAVTHLNSIEPHRAQVAALKRQHAQEIEAYRSALVSKETDEAETPSPQTPLPRGADNA